MGKGVNCWGLVDELGANFRGLVGLVSFDKIELKSQVRYMVREVLQVC